MSIDKQADIIIADHARKESPVGSVSWTFIDKSVRSGKLEDTEKHPAGPVTKTTRAVGSSQPTKSTRTPYTAADDKILRNWIAKAERSGLHTKGNVIYEQLEKLVWIMRRTIHQWSIQLTLLKASSSHVSVLARPLGKGSLPPTSP